jgi:hypothetical protein
VINLGATFQIDELRTKKIFPKIKRRDSYFGSGGEENPGFLFQKDIEDPQNPWNQREGISGEVPHIISMFPV